MTSVTITAKGDKIAWSDVLAGLARAKGYDDQSLKGLLPDSSFNPNKAGAKLTIAMLDPTNVTWQKDVSVSRTLVSRLRG